MYVCILQYLVLCCVYLRHIYRKTQKNENFLKTQQKLKKSKKKNNWQKLTITTCLLRDSNPNYHCLKITSCRWCPAPRMRFFTAITHFKSSRYFVSLCIYISSKVCYYVVCTWAICMYISSKVCYYVVCTWAICMYISSKVCYYVVCTWAICMYISSKVCYYVVCTWTICMYISSKF